MDLLATKVAWTAVASRLIVWAISVVANILIPDHDPGTFKWTESPAMNESRPLDNFVYYLTEGLTRWDGQYFLHIANNGYSYENTLAFFPLFPVTVRAVADVIYWMQIDYGLIHFSSALRLSAVLLNGACFTTAAVALYELSRKVLKDEFLAYKAALYFCINPASVFFSAAYSEALHCAISFFAMLKVEKAFSIKMGLLLGASTAVRANAILNLGFPLYKSLKIMAREGAIHSRLKQLEHSDLSETVANVIGDALIPAFLTAVATLIPFALYQWYAFTEYCGVTKPKMDFDERVIEYGLNHSLKLPSSGPSEWCGDQVPLPYRHIQSKYWNVGFLQYFEFCQIPNFVLAAPVLYLVFTHAIRFFRAHRYYCVRLGCTYFNLDPSQPRLPAHDAYKSRVLPKDCFVYVVHAAALAVFALLFVHVQISTRLIMSSSPFLYWVAALATSSPEQKPVAIVDLEKPVTVVAAILQIEARENLERSWRCLLTEERVETKEGKQIQRYFLAYAIIGTILFANSLPWT